MGFNQISQMLEFKELDPFIAALLTKFSAGLLLLQAYDNLISSMLDSHDQAMINIHTILVFSGLVTKGIAEAKTLTLVSPNSIDNYQKCVSDIIKDVMPYCQKMLKDLKNLIKSDKEILSKDSSVHNLTVDVVTIIDHISRYSPLVFYSMHESRDIESR